MAKGLDDLVEWLIAEISYSGDTGLSVDGFISAVNKYYFGKDSSNETDRDHSQEHGTGQSASVLPARDINLASKAWTWVVARDEVSVGPNNAWDHLDFNDILTLPKEEPPIDPSLSTDAGSGSTIPQQGPAGVKAANVTTGPSTQPRLFVSEETKWMTITGHGVDLKRIPLSEWKCLQGIASTGTEGIIQGDLRRLVDQDKRSVPKRTDFLAAKGYVQKRTVIARGTKTSHLWLTRFAPPELASAKEQVYGQVQGLDLSQHFLTKDLEPVPWCDRWTGTSIDHNVFSQTAIAIVKAWKVIRFTDLKKKMGVLGKRWQMKVLAREFRRIAAMGLVKYVAAMLPGSRHVLKDCVKYVREPTKEEWAAHIASGKKTSQYSDHTVDRQPKAILGGLRKSMQTAEQDADGDIIDDEEDEQLFPVIQSGWNPDMPLPMQVFSTIKRAGSHGISNPQLSSGTIGFAFRRFMFSFLQQAAKPGSQPAHLKHMQLHSELVRIGKTEAYIFTASAASSSDQDRNDSSSQAVEDSTSSSVLVSSQLHGTFAFSAPPATIADQNEPATITDLTSRLLSNSTKRRPPKRHYRRARTARPEYFEPDSTPRKTASAAEQIDTVGNGPDLVEGPEDDVIDIAANGVRPHEQSQQPAEQMPVEPKPAGAFIQDPNSIPQPKRRGRRKKSIIVLIRSERLKDGEFLPKGRGLKTPATESPGNASIDQGEPESDHDTARPRTRPVRRKRKARAAVVTSDDEVVDGSREHEDPQPSIVKVRYEGAEGRLVFPAGGKAFRFERTVADGSEPLEIQIENLADNPTVRDAPRGAEKALVFAAQADEEDSTWPYIFLFGDTPEENQSATRFQDAISSAREKTDEPPSDQESVFEAPQTKESTPRKGKTAKSRMTSWRCDECGGTWKNDIGLKYHLTKSKTTCNKDYTPPLTTEPARKRQRLEHKFPAPEASPAPTAGRVLRTSRPQPIKPAETPQRQLLERKPSAITKSAGPTPRGILADEAQPILDAEAPQRQQTPPPRPASMVTKVVPLPDKHVAVRARQMEILNAPQPTVLSESTTAQARSTNQPPLAVSPAAKVRVDADVTMLDPRLRGMDGDSVALAPWKTVRPGTPSINHNTTSSETLRASSSGVSLVPNGDVQQGKQLGSGAALETGVPPTHEVPRESDGSLRHESIPLQWTGNKAEGGPETAFGSAVHGVTNDFDPLNPPPFVMPADRDISKMSAAKVKVYQTSEIMKYFLNHTGGVFPSDNAVWFATIGVFIKTFPGEDPPRKRSCGQAIKTLSSKQIASEHVYAFRDKKGKFVACRLLVKNDVNPNGLIATAMKEKIQSCYPRVYIPPVFSPNQQDLDALQALEPDFEAQRASAQRALSEEIERLDAPFYETTSFSPRRRRAANDDHLSFGTGSVLKRKAEDDSAGHSPSKLSKKARFHDDFSFDEDLTMPDEEELGWDQDEEMPHYITDEPESTEIPDSNLSVSSAFKRFQLQSRRGRIGRRGPRKSQGQDAEDRAPSPIDELEDSMRDVLDPRLIPFSRPHVGGSEAPPRVNLRFLKPNTFLEANIELESDSSRSSSPPAPVEEVRQKTPKRRGPGRRKRQSVTQAEDEIQRKGADQAVAITGPFTNVTVINGLDNAEDACPNIPLTFFEQQGSGSFTVRGWMPDAAFILRSHLPHSLEEIGLITRGFFRKEAWADPDWRDFVQNVEGCMRWELSDRARYLLSLTLDVPEYFFINFVGPRITNMEEGLVINIDWAADNQLTAETIPYQALLDVCASDAEDYEDWDENGNPSPLKKRKRRGRPPGSQTKVRGGSRGRPRGSTRGRGRPRGTSHGGARGGTRSGTRGGLRGDVRHGTRGARHARRVIPSGVPRLPVFKKNRAHTQFPQNPDEFFQPSEDGEILDWKDEDTRIAAFVAVRTLLGGVDKVPDWGIMMRIFPDANISGLRMFWLTTKKDRQRHLDNFTEKFQEGFLKAYESGELPPLDFENVLSYDWRGLVAWTMRLSVQDAPELPATRDTLEAELSMVKTSTRGRDWQENYNHPQRSVWKKFQDATSEPATTSIDTTDTQRISDDVIARSWLRALCRTPPDKYSPASVKAALMKLGQRSEKQLNELLNAALRVLRSSRVIKQSKFILANRERPYQLSDHFTDRLDKLSNRDKFALAAQFKTRLDEAFRRNETVDIPYGADDGMIMATINLQASGRIRVEGVDLESIPFGFDPGNYESRKFPKAWFYFRTRVVPTATYVYNEDIEDVLAKPAGVQPPSRGSRNELGVWCDFFGEVAPEPWIKLVAAAVFSIATRGSMDGRQLAVALKPLVEEFEADMVVGWATEAGILAPWRSARGKCTNEWWWLMIAREFERMERGKTSS